VTTLAYDDLPPGSDIRRVTEPDRVQISVPAGEPPRAVVREAALQGFVRGSLFSVPALAIALVVFYQGIHYNDLRGVPLKWAWGFFTIFCAAIVMLIAWICYGVIIDSIRHARQQATVLAATPARLVIETSGPFGTASYDYARDRIDRFDISAGTLKDDRGRPRRVQWLELRLADGKRVRLLPGRDPGELKWVRGMIVQIMNLQAA
jgi:hypothetical protein